MKKPTYEEVHEYMITKGVDNRDEAEKFVDHYDSIGWVVGKYRTPMVKWKGAVNNWFRKQKNGWKKADETRQSDYRERQRAEAARAYREMEQENGGTGISLVREIR